MDLLTAPHETATRKRASFLNTRQAWLAWRRVPAFGAMEARVLALFCAIAAYTLRYHEAWDDEAQAWLIARDNSVWQIVRYRLHYEGAPPLWHLLLHLFHVAGGTYAGIGWLSIAIAAIGMYVWLRWSPFPSIVRILLPFTFFFQYQYAVIARSYVLFPVLTFALCALYRRKGKVVWFALVAGLLSNVSLQGFLVALTLVGLYAFDWYREGWLVGAREPLAHVQRRQCMVAATVFGLLACVAVYCAIPAPDLDFAIGDQVSSGAVHNVLVHIVGETPRNAPRPVAEEPIIAVNSVWQMPSWRTEPRAWLAAMIYPRSASTNHPLARWMFQNLGPVFLDSADAATWPLANLNLLACSLLIVIVLWLRARRQLRMLLPWLALILTGQVLWTAEHHAGMLLVALIAGLWIAAGQEAGSYQDRPKLDGALITLLTVTLGLQVAWSARAIHEDVKGSYDPGPETARWLKSRGASRPAAFGFPTVSIQPWFTHSPFFDVPAAWWQWSSNLEVDGIHRAVVATHPDVVVYGLEFPGDDQIRDQWLPLTHLSAEEERTLPRDLIVRDLRKNGYRETHRFCGARFARFGSAYRVCDVIFEPRSSS